MPPADQSDRLNENSRRAFLTALGPLALAPLLGAAQEPAASRGDVAKTPDKLRRPMGIASEVGVARVSDVECPNWPLKSLGAVVVHGDPEAAGKTVFESEDHKITGGVWTCSPGTFDLTFTWDEMALMLEGELIIEDSVGKKVRIVPGDFFSVPRGAKTRWTVVKPLRKLFFTREAARENS